MNAFSIKLLEERLRKEVEDLEMWKLLSNDKDFHAKRQAKGNIPSTEARIKDLEDSVNTLKNG